MASVGKAHSCPPAQTPETKLQISWEPCSFGEMEWVLIENENVDAGIDDEAIGAQQPRVVAVGRGLIKLEVEHHVVSGHAQHRTACMRWYRWKT